jgi:two-component system, LuxR family, response regulator FixJ
MQACARDQFAGRFPLANTELEPTIYIVDDDAGLRRSLSWLLESLELNVESFATGEEFLDAYVAETPGCLILDVRLPGMSGMMLQEALPRRGVHIPVLILTGHGAVDTVVRTMKGGAVDFLEKPVCEQALIDALQSALEIDRRERRIRRNRAQAVARFSALTEREREVMELVIAGQPNKIIADELDISVKTVEAHRARLMRKLEVDSLPDLVRLGTIVESTMSLDGVHDARMHVAP